MPGPIETSKRFQRMTSPSLSYSPLNLEGNTETFCSGFFVDPRAGDRANNVLNKAPRERDLEQVTGNKSQRGTDNVVIKVDKEPRDYAGKGGRL
jgi:hypothetical protein